MNECKIVEDLLPLYAEDLVSAETAEFIDEHCANCVHCRILLERSRFTLPIQTENAPNYQEALKRDRRHSLLTGVLIMAIGWALFMAVFAVGYAPAKLDREPIILTSPDGIHSFKGEYYDSLSGLNRGIYVTKKSRNAFSQGTEERWIEILDTQWSPDGTDLFLIIETENGETEMRIWYNNYDDTGSSGGVFPHISYNSDKHIYNDLMAEFTVLLSQWEEFPTGWESIVYQLDRWGEDSESAYIRYKTDNGYEGVVHFGFDFEGQVIWIIE